MQEDNEILVNVRRQPDDHRSAKYRLSDIDSIDWNAKSGGAGVTFMRQYFLYGYVECDKAVEGKVAHSGIHGSCPHNIKVCILKGDNKDVYDFILKSRDISDKPKGGNSCKTDIIDELNKNGAMRGTELKEILWIMGHGKNNIQSVLKKLADKKILIREKDPKDKRNYIYSINSSQK